MDFRPVAAAAAPYLGPIAALEKNSEKTKKTDEKTIRILEETLKAKDAAEQTLRDKIALLESQVAERDSRLELKEKTILTQNVALAALERESQQQRERISHLSERDILLREMEVIQRELIDKAPTLWKHHSVKEALADIIQRYPRNLYDQDTIEYFLEKYKEDGFAFHDGMLTLNHMLRIHELIKKAESLPKD